MASGEECFEDLSITFDHAQRRDVPDTLAPDGSEIRLLVTSSAGSMCEVRLPPGGVSVPVRHRTVEEMWYFLEGEGEVWRQAPDGASQVVRAGPGSALTIPLGCRFQFRNVGSGDLRLLCVTMPPWPGEQEAIVEADAAPWEPERAEASSVSRSVT